MNLQTVVYDADVQYAEASVGDLANSNAIVACCEGDAMIERDVLLEWAELQNDFPGMKHLLSEHMKKEPIGS